MLVMREAWHVRCAGRFFCKKLIDLNDFNLVLPSTINLKNL